MKTIFNGLECEMLRSEDIECLVTVSAGPRIISLTYKNSENLLYVFPSNSENSDPLSYRHYGGHRLWTTPESLDYTYHPENSPVMQKDGWYLSNPDSRGIQKGLKVTPIAQGLLIEHKLTNVGENTIETSPWGITMLRPNGFAIFPNEPTEPSSLLPVRSLSLWSYTKLNDPRLVFENDFTIVKQSAITKNFKIGAFVSEGWGAYVNNSLVFHKTFYSYKDNYPDLGANFEVYTDFNLLETETPGTIRKLNPKDSVINKEIWQIFPLSDNLVEDCRNYANLVKNLIN